MAPAAFLSVPNRAKFEPALATSVWATFLGSEDENQSVVADSELLDGLWGIRESLHGQRRIAVLDDVDPAMRAVLSEWFASVVTSSEASFLPRDQLKVALGSADAHDRFIAGVVTGHAVVLYRGSLQPVFVDRSWFRPGPSAIPDFDQLALTDFGHSVVLGDYEASSDAILYEHDRHYRRRQAQQLRAHDPSFGASLRRLRIQRGVSRSEFPGLTDKTIARIERNEVDRPRGRTLGVIARRLGVEPTELGSY